MFTLAVSRVVSRDVARRLAEDGLKALVAVSSVVPPFGWLTPPS